MLMLYFSGTGNSKYIANLFSKKVNAKCYSIEENIDFKKGIIQLRFVILFMHLMFLV